ncbi:hypothetical protein [Clostridium sp. DL1XJH146]
MKKVRKIFKAYLTINPSGFNDAFLIINFLYIVVTIGNLHILSLEINDYINNNNVLFDNSIFILIIFIVIPIFTSRSLYNDNSNKNKCYRNNLSSFFTPIPIKQKYIISCNFILLVLSSAAGLIITLFFLIVNIFIVQTNMISAYTGFFVLLFIFTFLLFSFLTGIDSVNLKKNKLIRLLPKILPIFLMCLGIYNLITPYAEPNTIVTSENMYTALGPALAPLFKSCRFFGGLQGLLLLIISIFIGYYLCCKLPLKILEKEG